MVPIFTYEGSVSTSPQSQPSSQSLASDKSSLLHYPGQVPHHTRSHPPIQERCSSAVITGPFRGSRPTCGSLSPISPHKETSEQNSVFSPWKQFQFPQPSLSSCRSVSSMLSSVREEMRSRPKLSMFLLFWAALAPTCVGLFIGLTLGWTTPYSIAATTALFITSFCLLITMVTCLLTCTQVTGYRSGYQTIFGDDTGFNEDADRHEQTAKNSSSLVE